jgi:hypothetical protein
MSHMAQTFTPILESAARLERDLVGYLLAFDPAIAAAIVGLLLAAAVMGSRLAKFSHPARPRLSLLVRHGACCFICWPSWLVLIALLVFTGLVFALGWSLGWQESVWLALKAHFYAVAVGAVAGVILGGLSYYYFIPGMERPMAVGVNEPIPHSCGIYDPEKYFRV